MSAVEAAQHFCSRGAHAALGSLRCCAGRRDAGAGRSAADARPGQRRGRCRAVRRRAIAHKDIFVTATSPAPPVGCWPATARRSTPPWCQRPGQAGMVTASSSCDEFAMGSSTKTRPRTGWQEPWDPRASRAARLWQRGGGGRAPDAGATGTDTGGSIRQPAASAASPASSRPTAAPRATA